MTAIPPATEPAPPPESRRRRRPARHSQAPRLAEGIELIGEYEGSGFKEAPYIARRGDGQTIQLTQLLHLVAANCDGEHDEREVARLVSSEFGRKVSAGNVEFLVERKLRPLGVLAEADGSSPEIAKPDQLLALKFRTALVPERYTNVVTKLFKPLFWPPVMVMVVAAFVALDVWLLGVHGIGEGVRAAVYQPWLLLVFFGAVVLATAFHEMRPRDRLRIRRGAARRAGRGHLCRLAGLLLRCHRRLPARQGRPPADRPRRHLLQRDLRARDRRPLCA